MPHRCTLSSGGLRRYVEELSLALAREFPGDTYTLLSDQPFEVPSGAPPNLVRGKAETPRGRWWLWDLRNAILRAGLDLFHGTNFEVPYFGGTPAVMTIHDLSPWRNPEWHSSASRVRKRTPWLLRLRRARLILTVSEAVRREVIAYFGVAADRVRAVPLAASRLFAPVQAPEPERPFLLFVGTLEPRKNLPALVEAWRATRGETGADLVIAGRRRADSPPIRQYEGLRLLGEVAEAELPALYSQALAFVYPSHYEGFGLPVLEAMQCGCPVIASNDAAIAEVTNGAALLCGTPLELADAMRNIGHRKNLLRQAGPARAPSASRGSAPLGHQRCLCRGADLIETVLMLAPEPPYPLNGGGAFRTASLVHYFAQFAQIDLILFSESGKPALLPPGLVRSQTVIPLPPHGKGTIERYLRNAGRAVRGVPPLIDRLSRLRGIHPGVDRRASL